MSDYRDDEARSPADQLRFWVRGKGRFGFDLIEDPKNPTAPATLLDRDNGKTLSFPLGAIRRAEEAKEAVRGSSYLRILLDDGRTFALASVGFVFEPSFASTGPVPDCPPVASFPDFYKLLSHLEHLIDDRHEGHDREALQTLMILLAFLDGARAIGLSVDAEEPLVEAQLRRLEAG